MHWRIGLCLLWLSSVSWAEDTVDVQYSYWRSASPASLAQVKSLPVDNWQQVAQLGSYGFDDAEYWIRLGIHNKSPQPLSRIFRFVYPVLDEVDIYQFVDEELNLEWHLGDTVPGIARDVHEKSPAFRLTLLSQQQSKIYIRVAGINAMVLTMEALDDSQHDALVQTSILISGLVYGILLVMALYNLSLAAGIFDRAYFYYVAYVVCFIAFVLAVSGDGYYFLWRQSPNFNSLATPLFAGLLMVPSLLFPLYFLEIKRHSPIIARLIKWAVAIVGLYLVCIPFMGLAFALKVINVYSALVSAMMLAMGVYLSIKKVPFAVIYTLAWCSLLAGLVLLPLSSLGFIESNSFTRNANLLGGVIECVVLSLALAQRFRKERSAKIELIQHVLTAKSEAANNLKMFEELFELAPVGIFRFKLSGELVAVNPALTKMLGFKDATGLLKQGNSIRGYFDNGLSMAREVIRRGSVIDRESTLTTNKGELRTCSISMRVQTQHQDHYVEGYVTDISERKHAQNIHELMERERMAVLEQLIIGIAHEINTPLGNNITSLSHGLELLKAVETQMQGGQLTKQSFDGFIEDSHALSEIMSKNLQKITSLVERFKLVSVKNMDIELADIDIKQHLNNIIEGNFFIEESVQIILEVNGSGVIHSYPVAWHIILDQLLENSMLHGFKERQSDRKIMITLQQQGDNHWQFYYEDNGRGLADNIANKVFDPFVTSMRGNDENAGLGMYRIYNVVQQVLKGKIKVLDGPGFKIQIRFHLPQNK